MKHRRLERRLALVIILLLLLILGASWKGWLEDIEQNTKLRTANLDLMNRLENLPPFSDPLNPRGAAHYQPAPKCLDNHRLPRHRCHRWAKSKAMVADAT